MQDYSKTPYKYYISTYSIQNNDITLGDISEVEMDWKPVDNEKEVEINTSLIKDILSKSNTKEVNSMDEKIVLELNQKIEDKTNEINELSNKNTDFSVKNAELNEAVVNANKVLEETNAKVASLTEELNECKTELDTLKAEKVTATEKAEKDQKTSEINSYFETEIPKNKFSEEEINSLKPYVESLDLVGLKNAESELCTKKFKELKIKEISDEDTEINSKSSNFITFVEKEKKIISDKIPSFFN